MIKSDLKVLLFARKRDVFSERLYKYLKYNFKIVDVIWSRAIGEKIEKKNLKKGYDFIFCFRSYFILDRFDLKKANIAAINFHPATPEYRGYGGANFAILDNAKYFGNTIHFMNEKIDQGKIISVDRFKINKSTTIETLTLTNYKKMLEHAKKIINKIKDGDLSNLRQTIKNNVSEKWSKKIYRKKDLDKLFNINYKNEFLNKEDFDRIIRSTSFGKFQPYIKIHGHVFILKND